MYTIDNSGGLPLRAGPSRLRRILSIGVVMTMAIFGTAVVGVTSAGAAHAEVSLPGSDFEIEDPTVAGGANLVVDDGGSLDWENVAFDFDMDALQGEGDDAFGQGTKEDTQVPSLVTDGIPPNKSDLTGFGIYAENAAAGDFVHVFWARVQEPNGTTNMDFEFNQSETLGATGYPVRTGGDLLVEYHLSQGGTNPTLSISRWIDASGDDGSGGPALTASSCEAANKLPCWSSQEALDGALATASINTAPLAEVGVISPGVGTLGGFSPFTFGEASIDLDVFLGNGASCTTFSSVYLKSRSSDSFTAAIKDVTDPIETELTNCGSVKINKVDDAGTPLPGAEFTLYEDDGDPDFEPDGDDPIATDPSTGDNLSCTTDANGMCTIVNILFGTYWIDETVVPEGHVKDALLPQKVSIPTTDQVVLNFTNPRERGSLLIEKVVKGTTTRLGGAAFQYDSSGDGTVDTDIPAVSGETGLFCIDNLLEGSYLVAETTVPGGFTGSDPQTVAAVVPSTCAERIAEGDAPDATFENEAQPTITTSANETVTVGADISDTAVLAGGHNPTGTITFNLYSTSDCSGDPIFTTSLEVNGNGSYGPVSYTTDAVGTFNWLASYSGDGSNAAATHACGADGEVDTVNPASPTLATTPKLLPNDTASLSGGFGTLDGTISFELHDTADCDGTALYSETLDVNGEGDYSTSNSTVFITADGTYSWLVTYSGDANNNGDVSTCTEERYVIDITPDP